MRTTCVILAALTIGLSLTAVALENTFGEVGLGYTIDYPSDWVAERTGDYSVRFTGLTWTTASRVAFAIQNVASTAIGGVYNDTDELLDAMRCQLVTGTGDICIYMGEVITVIDTSGRELVGPQIIVEYTYDGDIYKEWLAIVPHGSGDIFYILTYTALQSDYDRYESTVIEMVSTWTIGGTTGSPSISPPTSSTSTSASDIITLLEDTGHLGPYDYAAGSYDKRYYDIVVTTHGYMAIAVLDEAGESISGWIYTPSGVKLVHKPGNYAEIYSDAYEVFPGTYQLKVGQDTMVTESDFAVYVFFSLSPFTVEDLIAVYGPEYRVMP